MSKKLNVMSLSIEPELQDLIKRTAKVHGVSASKFIRDVVGERLSEEVDDCVKLNLDDDVKEAIQTVAHNKGQSESQVLSDVARKYLVGENDALAWTDFYPVVLKVPVELKGDKRGLIEWLQVRAKVLINKLAGS